MFETELRIPNCMSVPRQETEPSTISASPIALIYLVTETKQQ